MPTSPSQPRGAKPSVAGKPGNPAAGKPLAAAPSAPNAAAGLRSSWPFALLVCVIAAVTVIISALPASMAARFLPAAVHAEDFSGSVWHGSAGKIAIYARDAGAIEWRVHPADLLHLHIVADLHWVKRGFVLDGAVDADRSALRASNIQGGGPIEDLADLGVSQGWRGIAEVHVRELIVGISGASASLQSAVGELAVTNVAAPLVAEGADLGGYALLFADPAIQAGSDVTAELKDTEGPLAVEAMIRISVKDRRGTLSGTLQERTAAVPALRQLLDDLSHLHARDAQGRIPVDVEFTL